MARRVRAAGAASRLTSPLPGCGSGPRLMLFRLRIRRRAPPPGLCGTAPVLSAGSKRPAWLMTSRDCSSGTPPRPKGGVPSRVQSLHVAFPFGHPFDRMLRGSDATVHNPSHSRTEVRAPGPRRCKSSIPCPTRLTPRWLLRRRVPQTSAGPSTTWYCSGRRPPTSAGTSLPAGRLVPCSALLNPPDGLQGVPSTWGALRHPGHRAPSSMRSLYLGHGLRRRLSAADCPPVPAVLSACA